MLYNLQFSDLYGSKSKALFESVYSDVLDQVSTSDPPSVVPSLLFLPPTPMAGKIKRTTWVLGVLSVCLVFFKMYINQTI